MFINPNTSKDKSLTWDLVESTDYLRAFETLVDKLIEDADKLVTMDVCNFEDCVKMMATSCMKSNTKEFRHDDVKNMPVPTSGAAKYWYDVSMIYGQLCASGARKIIELEDLVLKQCLMLTKYQEKSESSDEKTLQ